MLKQSLLHFDKQFALGALKHTFLVTIADIDECGDSSDNCHTDATCANKMVVLPVLVMQGMKEMELLVQVIISDYLMYS